LALAALIVVGISWLVYAFMLVLVSGVQSLISASIRFGRDQDQDQAAGLVGVHRLSRLQGAVGQLKVSQYGVVDYT
jgi:hypothetical protein